MLFCRNIGPDIDENEGREVDARRPPIPTPAPMPSPTPLLVIPIESPCRYGCHPLGPPAGAGVYEYGVTCTKRRKEDCSTYAGRANETRPLGPLLPSTL